jgi:hypothetical protein
MINPFRRFFRRKSAVIGTPPSERPLWHDAEAHTADFAARYAEPMNYLFEQRMIDEAAHGGSHGTAIEHGPETALPIREGARKLRRSMRER